MKFNNNKKIKYKVFKAEVSPEKLRKIKRDGINLKIGNRVVNYKENKEIFSRYIPKPVINCSSVNEGELLISFSIPIDADKAFIDVKEINRYQSNWREIAEFSNIKKEKIYEFLYSFPQSQAIKIRITYSTGRHLEFDEILVEDPLYKFFYDPPEIVIHSKENISLTIFNLNRFLENGYIRIFKKENEEIEQCIHMTNDLSSTFVFNDDDVFSNNYYEYRAEVSDNNGNVYKTTPKKILYKRGYNLKNVEINQQENTFSFKPHNAVSFKIEKYNLKTESIETIPFTVKEDEVVFKISDESEYYDGERFSSYLIHVEGYDELGYLAVHGEESFENKREFSIFDERITTNSRKENIISWNFTGNVDTFIVTSKSSLRNQLLKIVSHRRSPDGYSYCIDTNYKNERIKTEYVINAIDEFGTIISKKRLNTNGES